MMTHHVVHESFKNNNIHNIVQGAIPIFRGANTPSCPPKCNPDFDPLINLISHRYAVRVCVCVSMLIIRIPPGICFFFHIFK